MRIAVSSSTFRRPLAGGELTQLEWFERCATGLGADGVVAALEHFPRTDAEYTAQARKVCVDLGVVPFGIDAPELFDATSDPDRVFALATAFGALVVRTVLPPPGDVPPAAFQDAVRGGKAIARAAKAANVTVLIASAGGTLGADADGVKHLVKDVDSAWLRACPSALREPGPKERVPAYAVTPADHPADVAARAIRAWIILDAPDAERPWEQAREAIGALRAAEAEHRIAVES